MLGNITFEIADSGGWMLKVLYRGTVIGHVRQSLDSYGYYNGAENTLAASITDTDLQRLKERIRKMHGLDDPSDG